MDWTTVTWISYVVLWVIVVIQVILTITLARLVGQMMSRRFPGNGARVINPGPEIGTRGEGWGGTDLLGNEATVRFPRERGVFLLYMAPHCTMCAGLLPAARRFVKEIAAEAELMWVIVQGSRDFQIGYAKENGLTQQTVFAEDQLPDPFRVGGAPFGLWLDAAGEVRAKGMINNREHLESLRHAAATGHPSVQSFLAAQTEAEEQKREQAASAGTQ
jgi:methylamine dehydrogenase accessory protein MauD